MNNTVKLLERVREAIPPYSKNAVARAIHADEANIRRYYKGKGYPNGISQIEIAKILKMDVADVIAYIAEDKAKSTEAKAAARRHLPRVLAAIPLTIVGIVAALAAPEAAYASTAQGYVGNPSIHYVYLLGAAGLVLLLAPRIKFTLGLAARTRGTAAA